LQQLIGGTVGTGQGAIVGLLQLWLRAPGGVVVVCEQYVECIVTVAGAVSSCRHSRAVWRVKCVTVNKLSSGVSAAADCTKPDDHAEPLK
jgi:hypothetical protein